VTWSPSEDETRHPTVILVTVTAGEPFDRVPMRPVRVGFAGADLVAELRELSAVELAQAGDDYDRPLLQTRDAAETQWTSVVEGPAVRTHTEAQDPAPANDWREAARGIPVWSGARVIFTESATDPRLYPERRGRSYAGIAVRERHEGVWVVGWLEGEWSDREAASLVPDLSDPDTQAAYLRRLAIMLGCPEEVAGEGVVVYPWTEPGWSGWIIEAGSSREEPGGAWAWRLDLGTDDRLLALARAWPADRRVRG
jgi:hypothetical protein